MAILRVSNGSVYATYEDINALTAPMGMEVGSFPYPEAHKTKWASQPRPLTQGALDFALGELSANVEGMVKEAGFKYEYRRVGCFVPARTHGEASGFSFGGDDKPGVASIEISGQDIANYMAPHIVRVNNWHFCLSGAFIKGLQLTEDLQAVIYVTAGEYQRIDPTVQNWVIFPLGEPSSGLSFFECEPNTDGVHETDPLPDLQILETMKF